MLKRIKQTKNMLGAGMSGSLSLDVPQNIQFKGVLLLPKRVGSENLECNVTLSPARP